jgi:hypothetical protein
MNMSTIAGTTNGAQLTTAERADLARYEEVIAAGKRTFLAVGQALAAVQEGRLYREQADTFEGYCSVRWGIARTHAYRLMRDAEAVEECGPMGHILENERQARALAAAPKGQRGEVLEEAAAAAPKDAKGKPKVTAKQIERVVAKRKAPDDHPAPAPAKSHETPPKTPDDHPPEPEIDELEAATRDEPAADRPGQQFSAYNADCDRAVALYGELRDLIRSMVARDGGTFAGWLDKTWVRACENNAADFAKWKVSRFDLTGAASRDGGRPFLYVHEDRPATKRKGAA